MENVYEVADSYQQLCQNIKTLIRSSRYRVASFIDELNMKDATFYQKMREDRWTPEEIKKIAPMLVQQRGPAVKGGSGENL